MKMTNELVEQIEQTKKHLSTLVKEYQECLETEEKFFTLIKQYVQQKIAIREDEFKDLCGFHILPYKHTIQVVHNLGNDFFRYCYYRKRKPQFDLNAVLYFLGFMDYCWRLKESAEIVYAHSPTIALERVRKEYKLDEESLKFLLEMFPHKDYKDFTEEQKKYNKMRENLEKIVHHREIICIIGGNESNEEFPHIKKVREYLKEQIKGLKLHSLLRYLEYL